MRKIKFSRDKGFADCLIYYDVFVDGSKVTSLSDGQSVEVHVPVGKHIIKVKSGWRTAQEIVDFSSVLHVELLSNLRGLRILLALPRLLGFGKWVTIRCHYQSNTYD